ncbi:MAG: cytidine deaminase [Oligoflexia bacterium]|nr:cytidine deaminase [Oligoflexia bacterium]
MPTEIEKAYQHALKAQSLSYSPYSKFQVGCSIKFKDVDELVPGCNVENASYGATICAERNALIQSVARFGKKEIEYVVVVAKTNSPTPPCALCLQVFSEFGPHDFPIWIGNSTKLLKKYMFRELLPISFDTLDDRE